MQSLATYAQRCVWANNSSGTKDGIEAAWDIKRKSDGNLLVSGLWGVGGQTPYTMNLGSYTLSSPTQYNFFLAQYDTSGNVDWVKSFRTDGPLNNIYGSQCRSDGKGNIYLVGTFSSKRLFLESFTLTNTDTASPTTDAFVAKFTSNGSLLWAVPVSGVLKGNEYVYDVVIDAADNVYISGSTSSDTMKIAGNSYSILMPKIVNNMFVAKMSPDGAVLWFRNPEVLAKNILNPVGTNVNCMAYANDGIVLTGGHIDVPIVFGKDTLKTGPAGNFVSFVLKYDTSGNVKWVHDIGTDKIYSNALTCDNMGNTYVTGCFLGASTIVDWKKFISAGKEDFSYAMADVFVVKYDGDGKMLWAESYGTRGSDEGYAITSDGSGHIFVGGRFAGLNMLYYGSSGTIKFDGISFTSFDKADDLFVVSFNSYTGKPLNGFQLRCGGLGVSLLADNIGSLYLTGDQWETNPLKIAPYLLPQTSGQNIFFAKFKTELPVVVQDVASALRGNLRLYPNPTSGELVIALDSTNLNSFEFILYTLTGQIAFKILLKEENSIDLSGLSKGVYLYRVTSDGHEYGLGRLILK